MGHGASHHLHFVLKSLVQHCWTQKGAWLSSRGHHLGTRQSTTAAIVPWLWLVRTFVCVEKMESGKEKHLSVKVCFFIKGLSRNHSLNFIPTEILCPDLPNPLGGVVNLTSRIIGSTVTYSCNEGFILNGSAEGVCQEDGTWSITPPSCSLGRCIWINILS